jgi:hypothetical protein
MEIISALNKRFTDTDAQHGWIFVSEKEWNKYWKWFKGDKSVPRVSYKTRSSLTFRGCQLRVL